MTRFSLNCKVVWKKEDSVLPVGGVSSLSLLHPIVIPENTSITAIIYFFIAFELEFNINSETQRTWKWFSVVDRIDS